MIGIPSAVACDILGPQGKMLSSSKSDYSRRYRYDTIFFNANVYLWTGEKIWYGDINVTKSRDKLQLIADELGEIFVTAEQPFRWEEQTRDSLMKAYVSALPCGGCPSAYLPPEQGSAHPTVFRFVRDE